MSLCKLCGMERSLVKAHIIPESMYPFEEERRERLIKVPSNPGIHVAKSPIGEYDHQLVCRSCEGKFSSWDDYACCLFGKSSEGHDYYIDLGEGRRAYKIASYDYPKLKLFFVSLLWRASESDRAFFENVSVGTEHTRRLKQMICNKDPGQPEEYSVLMGRFTHHRDDAHKAVMNPQKQRWDHDQIWYRFYFAGHTCAIKVDKRPAPAPFCRYILRPGEPLYGFEFEFNETLEYKAMVRAVRNHPGLR